MVTPKIVYTKSKQNIRKYYFTNRITSLWNSLPAHIINSNDLINIENNLDKHWTNQDLVYDNFKADIRIGAERPDRPETTPTNTKSACHTPPSKGTHTMHAKEWTYIKIAHVCIKFCIYKYNISITILNSQPVNLENGRCIVPQAWQGHRKGTKGPSPAENPDQYYVYLMAGICDLTKNIRDLAWVRDYRDRMIHAKYEEVAPSYPL